MQLDPNFREFIKCLNAAAVRYLVIGGYAVMHHGHIRPTKDIDIWVEPDGENSERVVDAIKRFGFGGLGYTSSDFREPGFFVRFGRPPLQIDILTSSPEVEFAGCYARRETVDADGVAVSVIGRDDLIASKYGAGRPQDLADIDELTPSGNPDRATSIDLCPPADGDE